MRERLSSNSYRCSAGAHDDDDAEGDKDGKRFNPTRGYDFWF